MSDARVFTLVVVGGSVVAFLIAISAILLVLILSLSLLKQVKLQIAAKKELDLSHFEFEKQLALVRVRLERSSQQWQQKAGFAEKTLSMFHEMRLLLETARQKKPGAARTFSDYKTAKKLLDEHDLLEHSMRMQQHSAFALFGSDGSACYSRLLDTVEDVRRASVCLSESRILDQELSADMRATYERKIWSEPDGTDEVTQQVAQVMTKAYHVFGAALNTPFTENVDG